MKVNEIKKTVEQVVRVEYVAEDGQIFYSKDECEKYEESALFAVSSRLKRLNTKELSVYDLLGEGSEECLIEIFDVQTDDDLETLRRYLYLKALKNGASEKYIDSYFTSKDGTNNEYVFDNVTKGHEVIIWWGWDMDCFNTYRDGSIEGYLNYLRDKWTKFITPETTEN